MSAISSQPQSSPVSAPRSLLHFLTAQLEGVMNVAFAMTRNGGLIRNLIFIWGALLVWIILAIIAHPLDRSLLQGISTSTGQALSILNGVSPFTNLAEGIVNFGLYCALLILSLVPRMFSPDVLRHILTYLVPFITALWIASIYLADIFELDSTGIAVRFLRQAAFATSYHHLNIENGQVADKDRNSPLLMIGGPGIVNTRLENVAVFEKLDGQVHIIGRNSVKEKSARIIDGFERLREVIDLRNQVTQVNELSVEGRTRDGIRIIAQNVRIEFSILRSRANDTQAVAATPYSYDEQAIETLVYRRSSKYPWQSVMKGIIRRSLQAFISGHKLSEFLAASSFPEMRNRDTALNFMPRQEITELFLNSQFNAAAARSGLQLNWIDIGTWVVPASASPVNQKHLDAWKMIRENENRRKNLETMKQESRSEELLRLIRDVPIIASEEEPGNAQDNEGNRKYKAIYAYLRMLRSAQADIVQQSEEPSVELEAAINFLSDYLKEYLERTGQVRWLQGPSSELP